MYILNYFKSIKCKLNSCEEQLDHKSMLYQCKIPKKVNIFESILSKDKKKLWTQYRNRYRQLKNKNGHKMCTCDQRTENIIYYYIKNSKEKTNYLFIYLQYMIYTIMHLIRILNTYQS